MLRKGKVGPGAPMEHVEGSVERVTYHNEENGFCVLRVKARGQRALTTVVGNLPNVVPGEWVQADGTWVMDREHGRQFRAEALQTAPPESVEGIKKFLGSGLIKGIGPVYAGKLVDHFGKDIFEIIEHQSSMLERVEGIGKVRRLRIKESWVETREVRAIMAFLLSHGVSTTRAFRIYKTYGDKAIQQVQADPYCLARDIHGIGFKLADQVAEKLGIEKTSDLRARAGVEFVLMEITHSGHCAYPRPELSARATEMLDIPEEIIERAIDHGLEQGRLFEDRVIGYDDPLIYLAAIYLAEKSLAERLKALAKGRHPCPPIDVERAIEWSEQRIGLELADRQKEAIRMGVTEKLLVLTGGPGVGKTTLVNVLIKILTAKRLHVVLCAPTGRAAKRLAETSGCEAKTLHRLLAFDPRQGGFRHDETNPLTGDVFVVDESSMIDVSLAWQFVRALPKESALVIVGDVDQLPSVGPGTVLRDIINSEMLPVTRLDHVFRQAACSDIIVNAHRINEGKMPVLKEKGVPSDFFFDPQEDPEQAARRIVRLVTEHIPKKFGFDPVDDVQVLAPMRRGALGSQNLNQLLQHALNPNGVSIERFGITFRENDKVMQLQNDYDKEVFNGDIGRIRQIDAENREMVVCYDGRDVIYDLQELDELTPSYAITIHKSQGSEYPCVVVPIHTQHYVMLQRNLLYTAITRGRRLVVLVGTPKAMRIAVNRLDAEQRITTLRERLMSLES
ncbi:MAG: ATP-dependent RecD-like DNA helicase [Spartobacteria bacterium]|nr:ATP-dependent RecD-like DNA helicase [Spartobacteria bacterium]